MKHIFLYMIIYIYIYFSRIPHTWSPHGPSWVSVLPISSPATSMATIGPSGNLSTPRPSVNVTTSTPTTPSTPSEDINWRMGLGLGLGVAFVVFVVFIVFVVFLCKRRRQRLGTASRESLLMSDLIRRQGENVDETQL